MALFLDILFIAFFFGLCVGIHEFGHLLAGLWRGLVVERFSIGFGPKLWGFRRRGVEYIVSTLPFGGYVALPQLEPAEQHHDQAGNPIPPAKPLDRIITAFAGPFFNLLFGFFLALFVWWFGIYKPAPADRCEVFNVPATSAEYAAGLRPGDVILAVNGKGFKKGWQELAERIVLTPGDVTLHISRGGVEQDIFYRPAPNPDTEGLGFPFFEVREPVVVQKVMDGTPAAAAGLQTGDEIVTAGGAVVTGRPAFIKAVQASGGKSLALEIRRKDVAGLLPVTLTPRSVMDNGKAVYRIGTVLESPLVLTHPNPWQQFVDVMTRTRDTLRAWLTPGSRVQARHMSGPVGIAQGIYLTVHYGSFMDGLSFIVLITFSLAVFNLLPLPVLDGGHIFMALIEMVIRRRIPVRVAYWMQTGFAVLLISFMLYVTVFDIKRFGLIRRHLAKEDAAEAPAAPPPAAPAATPTATSASPAPAAPK